MPCADRQRGVIVGTAGKCFIDEEMARCVPDRREHGRVADPPAAQSFHEALPGAPGGHSHALRVLLQSSHRTLCPSILTEIRTRREQSEWGEALAPQRFRSDAAAFDSPSFRSDSAPPRMPGERDPPSMQRNIRIANTASRRHRYMPTSVEPRAPGETRAVLSARAGGSPPRPKPHFSDLRAPRH